MREGRVVCDYQVAGLECDKIGDVDAPCKHLHSTMTKETFQKVVEIDLLMIEFEKYVLDGITDLSTKCDAKMKSYIERFGVDDKDPCIRYKACLQLWHDLMPAAGHPLFVNTDSRRLISYLRERDPVVSHFKNFLLERWEKFTSGRCKFASEAVKRTEVYLMFQLSYYIFGLDAGKIKLSRSPKEVITSLEISLEKELLEKPSLFKERYSFTLMIDKDNKQIGKVYVTCVARRFIDALYYLTESTSNPLESVMKFSKFQIQLSMRQDTGTCFYPDLKHYLLWLEFFTSLSIMTIAKLKTESFAEMAFFLPNNYLALVQFIQASFPSSAYPVEETIAWWEPGRNKRMKFENLLSERLKGFAFVISGHRQGVKIIQNILAECSKKITSIGLLERFLILGLTMICNIGHAVPVESEMSLLSTLSHLVPPDGVSDRIKNALHALKECNGILDIAKVLKALLEKRGLDERILFCQWQLGSKSRIKKTPLQDYAKFSNKFYNDKTLSAIHAPDVITEPIKLDAALDEELQRDEDELERDNREKEAQIEENAWKEKEAKAATKIQCAVRNFLSRKHKEQKIENDADTNAVHAMFANRKIDDRMCGVCGYSFSNKLANILDAQKSTLVGEQSVLNTGKAEEPWAHPLQKQTSFDAEHATNSPTEENESSRSIDMLLQKVKNEHFEDPNHIQKCRDLETFREKYIAEIEPNLTMIQQLLNNPDYRLFDENFVRKHYGQEDLTITRLLIFFKNAEKEKGLLMSRPKWDEMTAFSLENRMPRLMETFSIVEQYVIHVHSCFKQEKERRSMAAPIREDYYDEEQLEDEGGVIEPVVDAPSLRAKRNRNKSRTFHNKNR